MNTGRSVPVPPEVDVLIPTNNRPGALAVTLAGIASQSFRHFRVIISDQGDDPELFASPERATLRRVLESRGVPVHVHRHLPVRGMAEQRHFLLSQSNAPYVLFIDDDVYTDPGLIARLVQAIKEEACGFVGSAVVGLSYLHDVRPHEQSVEFWEGPVRPERMNWQGPGWERHRLHNAANLYHAAQLHRATFDAPRKYKVAWVGGCVLYDSAKLRAVGGFEFWEQLPAAHCGEDVLAQFRVMAGFGGCGLMPSGAYHLELPTTIVDRRVNAPEVLELEPQAAGA